MQKPARIKPGVIDKRFLLRLSPELFSRLHTMAQNERRSVTNMANVLIEDALKARGELVR